MINPSIDKKFGGEARQRIVNSKIRSVFTPYTPIDSIDLFMGREEEVSRLLDYLTTPGQHAILYGDRGVGKSSLAKILALVFYSRISKASRTVLCSSDDTFESILADSLEKVGVNVRMQKSTHTLREGGGAKASALVLKANIDTQRTTQEEVHGFRGSISPSFAASALKSEDCILIIDELDRVTKAQVSKLAELAKLLSDHRSPFKLLLVGIAHNISDLVDGHRSVERCLKQTKLDPMTDSEIREILTKGEKQSSVRFSELVQRLIVQMSAGYPHFAQLLALKSAELAIGQGDRTVSQSHLLKAISQAVQDVDASLKHLYDASIRPGGNDIRRRILVAMANLPGPEFVTSTIVATVNQMFDCQLMPASISQSMRGMTSSGPDTILRRLKPGHFRFNDPRMVSFVRLANFAIFERRFLLESGVRRSR